ncbi:MAG: DUF4221 family protein [Saprospiraceae bacterium]|nr:DUF4221 family protein [Lewinella sp.]
MNRRLSIKLFTLSLLFLIAGCKADVIYPDQEENGKIYDQKVELEYTRSLEFSVDSTFNIDNLSSVGTFEEDDEQYVYFLTNERIYIYATEDQKLKKIIPLYYEGPDATGPFSTFDGLAIVSTDSIFFLNSSTGTLSHLNDEGKLINKVDVGAFQSNGAFYGDFLMDIQRVDDFLMLPAYGFKTVDDYTTTFISLAYNMKQQTGLGVFHYPDLYNKAYWGYHSYLRWASVAYIPSKQQYFVNFPIDPRVYIYDDNFKLIGERYLGSVYFSAILPQSEDPERRFLAEGREVPENSAYFSKVSFFSGSLFHEDLGIYVRGTRIGKDKAAGKEKVTFSLIFADESLNKTGEYLIPDKYSFSVIFPTPEGLAFFSNEKYDWQENKIVFDVLRFKKTDGALQ